MATFELPLDTEFEAYALQFDLEGESFDFDIHWSRRDGAWYLTVSDDDGVVLIESDKILASWELGRDQSTILGSLITLDEEESGVPPGRYELGARVKLFYQESS
jgi:hypothetical protein